MQGFNMGRYYPPDASNPPRFNTTSHPLGSRARHIARGILTVRFELPFAVWCTHCRPEALVGQGVRFNAQKRKVGNYHSTPIWAFRMRHSACGGEWEIRTDPKNCAYVVVEGGRRRDYGEEEQAKGGVVGEGDLKFLTEEERERRREDAFAGFEGRAEEKRGEGGRKERVEELYEAQEVWKEPWEVNAKLRQTFRAKRKEVEREERWKEGLKERYGLEMEIVDEGEGDSVRAGLVEFGVENEGNAVEVAARKPLFQEQESIDVDEGMRKGRLKAEIAAEKSRKNLRKEIVGNTRVAIDPFLSGETKTTAKMNLGILKRKSNMNTAPSQEISSARVDTPTNKDATGIPLGNKPALGIALVDYDSD